MRQMVFIRTIYLIYSKNISIFFAKKYRFWGSTHIFSPGLRICIYDEETAHQACWTTCANNAGPVSWLWKNIEFIGVITTAHRGHIRVAARLVAKYLKCPPSRTSPEANPGWGMDAATPRHGRRVYMHTYTHAHEDEEWSRRLCATGCNCMHASAMLQAIRPPLTRGT